MEKYIDFNLAIYGMTMEQADHLMVLIIAEVESMGAQVGGTYTQRDDNEAEDVQATE